MENKLMPNDMTIDEALATMLPCPFCGGKWQMYGAVDCLGNPFYRTQGITLPCFCSRGTLYTSTIREAVEEVNRRSANDK